MATAAGDRAAAWGRRVTAARRSRPPLLIVVPALIGVAVAVLPVGYLLVRAGESGWSRVVAVTWRASTLALLGRSLALAAAVTGLCVLVAVGLALLVTRTDLPGRRVVGVLAALPLAIPSYVAAYAWLAAFRPVAGFGGAVLVLTACSYPYVFLPTVAALHRTDASVEEAARSLGRRPLSVLLTVTLPRLRSSIGAGALLVALYVLSDFGAVSLLRYDVFTRVIHFSYRTSFDRTPAAVLASLLVVITVGITLAEARVRRRADTVELGGRPTRPAPRVPLGRWRWPAVGACLALIGVAVGFPVASMIFWLVRSQNAGIDTERLLHSALSTVGLSFGGAVVSMLLALPAGILVARYRSRITALLEQACFAAHGLPGIVVALALVFFGIRFAAPIYQEVPLLLLAYATLFLPTAFGAIRSAVQSVSPDLEHVARSLGSPPAAVLRRVTVPLAVPGISAGFALVMLTCMKELPATLLLRPTGLDTLATSLWSQTDVVAFGRAAPYAVVLVVLAGLPTLLLTRAYRAGAPG
jgi:iron(III) transport system permease protein